MGALPSASPIAMGAASIHGQESQCPTPDGHESQAGPNLFNLIEVAIAPVLHPLLQAFAEEYLEAADLIAERKLAVGLALDGRPVILARDANLPEFPGRRLPDCNAVDRFSQELNVVTGQLRDRIQRLDSLDLVSQDVLIGVERTLARHLWMLRALQQPTALK